MRWRRYIFVGVSIALVLAVFFLIFGLSQPHTDPAGMGENSFSVAVTSEAREPAAAQETQKPIVAQDVRKPGEFEVTAYTACDPGMDGRGITSSGTKAKQWRTVAADPEILPPGTEVYIPHFADAPNGGRFVVEDTGGAIRGRRLDVYMASRSEALEFGRRRLEVHIREKGDVPR